MTYRRKKRRRRLLRKLFIYIAVICIVFFGTQYYYITTMLEPVEEGSVENITFEITSGQSTKAISQKLKERDLIKSTSVFKSYLKRHKLDMKVKAGNFILQRGMSGEEIAAKITSDEVLETAITIQEGLTIAQIDDKLTYAGLIEEGQLINFSIDALSEEELAKIPKIFLTILQGNGSNLEGLLFPDTYFISPSSFSLNSFVIRLLNTMDKNLTEEMRTTYKLAKRDLYEILNMASIIEREVRTSEDIPIVAGILWKRYDSNWHLGADATILYVTQGQDLTATDLEIDSAYNTRKFLGLPPTPIASPGLESIQGAVYPKNSEYWYYLTTPNTGEVIYARTNEEHNINKVKYLK